MALWSTRPEGFAPLVGTRFKFIAKPNPGWRGFVECEVLEAREPLVLRYSWVGDDSGKATEVTFRLEPYGRGTRLVFEHAGLRGFGGLAFDTVSLDGYFVDASGEMSWAHKDDPEWNGFVVDNASAGGTLVFGRITYELMASFWPTPQAMAMAPVVAKRMNSLPKIVFSRTLDSAAWSNTKIVKDGMVASPEDEERARERPRHLGERKHCLAVGAGGAHQRISDRRESYRPRQRADAIRGVGKKLCLKRTKSRAFENGNVFSSYEPTA